LSKKRLTFEKDVVYYCCMSNKMQNTLSGLRGRFFGIETSQGERINAQLVSVTPSYVNIWDRNANRVRRLAKSSIYSLSVAGKTVKAN
jgi:hypothetical protein